MFESATEKFLYQSRWLLAPLYLGLAAVLLLLAIVFFRDLIGFFGTVFSQILAGDKAATNSTILGILGLIDLALIGNLLVIVIFSGYENFVSTINPALGDEDRPGWMGSVSYSDIKIKIVGSLIAISAIELLKTFVALNRVQTESFVVPNQQLAWLVGIHLTFVLSGLIFSIMEWLKPPKSV